jgi:hypothetical protein
LRDAVLLQERGQRAAGTGHPRLTMQMEGILRLHCASAQPHAFAYVWLLLPTVQVSPPKRLFGSVMLPGCIVPQ